MKQGKYVGLGLILLIRNWLDPESGLIYLEIYSLTWHFISMVVTWLVHKVQEIMTWIKKKYNWETVAVFPDLHKTFAVFL